MKFESISFGSLTFLFDAAMNSAVTVDQQNGTITFSWGENMLDDYLVIGKDGKETKEQFTPEAARELSDSIQAWIKAIESGAISQDGEQLENIPQLKELVQQLQRFINEKSKYRTIRQGAVTNNLSKVKPKEKDLTIDYDAGYIQVEQGCIMVSYPLFLEQTDHKISPKDHKTSTNQLFDVLMVVLSETGAKSPVVNISLDDYMKLRGLTDKKEARKQVEKDLNVLFNARISCKGKARKGIKDFTYARIFDSVGIVNGIISVSFGTKFFYDVIVKSPVMQYPALSWRLDNKRNPNSYYFLRKIAEHKNMNVGKKNENTISVKTLINVAVSIPNYEDVKKSDRAFGRRIIDVFERDMTALEPTLTWEYCHSNHTPLTDMELENLDYTKFANLFISIGWKDYPDMTARIAKMEKDRKARARAKAKKSKKSE